LKRFDSKKLRNHRAEHDNLIDYDLSDDVWLKADKKKLRAKKRVALPIDDEEELEFYKYTGKRYRSHDSVSGKDRKWRAK
jgi:hypothetical protein